MRGLRSTLLLLAIFLGLLAYIYFVESERPASSDTDVVEKAFAIEADSIAALQIKADSGETTTLEAADGAWQIVEPTSVAADESEASAITSSLASLDVQRVVEEEPEDLEPFGLADPRIDVAFKLEEEADFRHLLIGEQTPTGGNLYASVEGESRVFLISNFLDRTFNRTTFDLRDKAILEFDRDEVDTVEVAGKEQTVRLARNENEWTLTAPWQGRGDYGTSEGLLGRLSTAQMRSIETEDASDLSSFGLDAPEITVTVSAASSQATLLVGEKSPDGTFYARDISRPLVFTVDSALVTDLNKEAAEYRRKDLFEFRPFNSTRLEVTRDGQTVAFEKVEGTDDQDEEEKWRQVTPSERDVDRADVDDLLAKLSNLRAQSFVESRADTGLDSPAVTVTVQFDEGNKEESVAFGRHGDEVFGIHGDESGAAKLDVQEFNEALKALDELQ